MRETKIKIDGREFIIRIPGVAAMPYFQLYRKLVVEPESLEDARRKAEELPRVVNEILRMCVEGPVDEIGFDGQLILLTAIGQILSESTRPERFQFFREERGG